MFEKTKSFEISELLREPGIGSCVITLRRLTFPESLALRNKTLPQDAKIAEIWNKANTRAEESVPETIQALLNRLRFYLQTDLAKVSPEIVAEDTEALNRFDLGIMNLASVSFTPTENIQLTMANQAVAYEVVPGLTEAVTINGKPVDKAEFFDSIPPSMMTVLLQSYVMEHGLFGAGAGLKNLLRSAGGSLSPAPTETPTTATSAASESSTGKESAPDSSQT